MIKKNISLIILVLLFLPSCRHIFVYQAKKQMQSTFDSLMGLSSEDIIIQLGSPQKIDYVGELVIYHYYKSYGTCTNAYVNQNWGSGSSWESYDSAEIVFKNNYAISWRGWVQR